MAFLCSVLLVVVPLAVVASLVSVSASSAAWCRTRAADIIVFVVVSCRFHQLCSRHAVRWRCAAEMRVVIELLMACCIASA